MPMTRRHLRLRTTAYSVVAVITSFGCVTGVGGANSGPTTPPEPLFKSEVMWEPQDGGCASGATVMGDKCTACDLNQPTDCFERCVAGNADACAVDGFLRARAGDVANAATSYERACDLGSGSGCEQFARALMRGEGRLPNQSEAMNLFERMCRAGRGFACSNFGVGLLAGRGRARDIEAADKFLTQGCNLGDQFGCQLRRDRQRSVHVDSSVREALGRVANCKVGIQQDCLVPVMDAGAGLELR